MFTARRRWERKGLQLGLLVLVVGGVFIVRQTQGELLAELYNGITRPLEVFQSEPNQQQYLKDAKVQELQAKITELESQNQNLKALLKYVEKEPKDVPTIPARVVGRSADNWWQQVSLNRGSLAGIQEGYVVKAEGGLVGLIDNVTSNTSRVLLISDMTSQVGVNISRTGAKGILRGDGSADAVLEFYEKVPNVKPGDVVSTSTYSSKFPSGVPIGKIKSLDLKRLPASVATVELFPPIRSLDWVTVNPKPPVVPAPENKDTQK
ncbi:rod shape-determining protein MreC [Plectonema cf. radiosum LEGE 06105]|uniref:Cell shape-determining protein MreC n=1 Tax=Plectonema cf. radiosum LEGE 06105 TaxID=945769 RepID=A0A8J7K1M4_9CYAN|nr:rod shape-determining protein MreC [Plectonema radiosum]MBE9214831.1 rod shape-determining protein MreC [Plectonema cf. radiosum LEGE 06105]